MRRRQGMLLATTAVLLGTAPAAMAASTGRVSVSSAEKQANSDSFIGPVSSNGRYVVFASAASNLVKGDKNGFYDVFIRDLVAGKTELVSVGDKGASSNGFSNVGSVSRDGRYVAFQSDATNLVPGDTNGAGDVFVRDRLTRTTELVSVSSSGVQAKYGG